MALITKTIQQVNEEGKKYMKYFFVFKVGICHIFNNYMGAYFYSFFSPLIKTIKISLFPINYY